MSIKSELVVRVHVSDPARMPIEIHSTCVFSDVDVDVSRIGSSLEVTALQIVAGKFSTFLPNSARFRHQN